MAKAQRSSCGRMVRVGSPTCPHCGVHITWYRTKAEMRAAEAAERRQLRDAERGMAAAEKAAKQSHVEGREGEAEKYNSDLNAWVAYLESGILPTGLDRETRVDFEALKPVPTHSPFVPGQLAVGEAPPELAAFMPAELSWSQKLVHGAKDKWNLQVEEAKAAHARATEGWRERERTRAESLASQERAHAEQMEQLRQQAASQCEEVDAFHDAFRQLEPDAVTSYFDFVLKRSPYAEAFQRETRLAFAPESRQLVVEDRLPTLDIVPTVKQRRYVKTHDRFEETERPKTQVKAIYASTIAQIALRTVDEIFRADPDGVLETVVYNGHVHTIDKASGKPVAPCLITLRTSRDALSAIDLRNVDPQACLKGLNASVSRDPAELAPVRPVIEFNMVDSRFIDESDVLSTLDQRPNLMELSPSEFENLITNLFEKMGLETRLTQASRDGGVDCVAYDPRPIFGGKVVIQAKRYKNTVGVAAVRDLYGTMLNEGASKGILVCTSGYGKASFDFANGKPVELLDGGNLLYLLKEHAGMEARIVVPDDWTDPVPDTYATSD